MPREFRRPHDLGERAFTEMAHRQQWDGVEIDHDEWVRRSRSMADRLITNDTRPALADLFGELQREGLLGAALHSEQGGAGLEIESGKMLPMLRILQNIGRASLPLGRVYEGHVNALRLIRTFGTPTQVELCREAVLRGEVHGIWNTGCCGKWNDITFENLPNGAIKLHGSKVFASGASFLTRPIVTGRGPDHDWQMILLEHDPATAEMDRDWWNPMGMEDSDSFRVSFEGRVVKRENLLGGDDDYSRQPWLSGGAIRFTAVQLGGAEALLDITRRHLQQTGRGGDPIQQERVAMMAMAVESGNLWMEGAARQADSAAEQPERFIHYVGLLRKAVETICFDVSRMAQQCIGVQGMLRPHPMERVVRDLLTYLRQPAPDAAFLGAGRFALGHEGPISVLWNSPTTTDP